MKLCPILEITRDESEKAHESTLVDEGNVFVVEYVLFRAWDVLNATARMIEGNFLEKLESAILGYTRVDEGGD